MAMPKEKPHNSKAKGMPAESMSEQINRMEEDVKSKTTKGEYRNNIIITDDSCSNDAIYKIKACTEHCGSASMVHCHCRALYKRRARRVLTIGSTHRYGRVEIYSDDGLVEIIVFTHTIWMVSTDIYTWW
jgi:hypothetical protein